MNRIFSIGVLMLLCLSLSIGTSQAVELMGQFDGFRETSATKELLSLEARHFELLHAGKVQEAEHLMKKAILPLREKIENQELKSWFVTRAYRDYYPNTLNVYLYTAPVSENEGNGAGVDVFFVQMFPTLEQFERLFEGQETINRMPVEGHFNDVFASARQMGNTRVVTLHQQNKVDSEITSVFARGTCTIIIENHLITSIDVVKEKKRPIVGFAKVFSARVIGLHKAKQGLQLYEDHELGWLQDRNRILVALADKTLANFRRLLKEEQGR